MLLGGGCSESLAFCTDLWPLVEGKLLLMPGLEAFWEIRVHSGESEKQPCNAHFIGSRYRGKWGLFLDSECQSVKEK